MSAHTPKPWVLSGTWPASVVIGSALIGLDQTPEGEANARLIASAPDLLEALRLWLDLHEKPAVKGKYGRELTEAIDADQVKISAAYEASRAAIAKAGGKL